MTDSDKAFEEWLRTQRYPSEPVHYSTAEAKQVARASWSAAIAWQRERDLVIIEDADDYTAQVHKCCVEIAQRVKG